MQLNVPDSVTTDEVTFVLDDGRFVSVRGDGEITVYSTPARTSWERYHVELPTVEFVAQNCDDKNGLTGNGTVQIDVIHRH